MAQMTDKYLKMCTDDLIQKFRHKKGTKNLNLRAGDSYSYKAPKGNNKASHDIKISINDQCFGHTELAVWIPTKHQLELILLGKRFNNDFEIFEERFFLFLKNNSRKHKSMSELFMGFFMHAMYNLRWDNELKSWLPDVVEMVNIKNQ